MIALLASCEGLREAPSARSAPSSTASPVLDAARPEDASGAVPTPRSRRLSVGELVLATEVDAIPAIFAQDDLFVDVAAGDLEWESNEPVVGLEINGDARAYPVRLLSLHEIVNDVVGGEPVAITWCPLCYTSIVFSRMADRELTFGVSGYLYYNNLVMYDHQSNTLWSQVLAQGIKGAYRGRRLDVLPSLLTTLGAWRELQPATRVLSAERLGTRAEDVRDPYVGYYTSGAAGVAGRTQEDNRLPVKSLVVGINLGDTARAYPLDLLQERGLVLDSLSATPLLLVYDEGLQSVLVYLREIEGRARSMELGSGGVLREIETGTLWDRRSGRGLGGPLAGASLTRIAAPLVFWFAWADIHPGTEIYSPDS